MISDTTTTILKEFEEMWKHAPVGSIKYMNGKTMTEWFSSKLQEVEREAYVKAEKAIYDLTKYGTVEEVGNEWAYKVGDIEKVLSHLKKGEK